MYKLACMFWLNNVLMSNYEVHSSADEAVIFNNKFDLHRNLGKLGKFRLS